MQTNQLEKKKRTFGSSLTKGEDDEAARVPGVHPDTSDPSLSMRRQRLDYLQLMYKHDE